MTYRIIPTSVFESARPNWRKDSGFYGYELDKDYAPGNVASVYTSSDRDYESFCETMIALGYTVVSRPVTEEERAALRPNFGEGEIVVVTVEGDWPKAYTPGPTTQTILRTLTTNTGFSFRFVDDAGVATDPVTEGLGDEIVVHLWSVRKTPGALPKAMKPRAKLGRVALCGGRWSRTDRSFDPHGGCSAQSFDDGTVLAEAFGRDVWLLHPFKAHAGDDRVIGRALRDFELHFLGLPQTAATQARIRAAALEMLLGVRADGGWLGRDRTAISRARERVNKIAPQLQVAETRMTEIKRAIALHDAEPDPAPMFAAEIDRIRNMPKVLRVAAKGNIFSFVTTELNCTNPKTKKVYKLGSMAVSVEFGDRRSIQITNRTRMVNGGAHPHIRPTICWGNAGELISQLIEAGELAALASVVIGYLETCNPDDPWGRTIVEWPPIDPVAEASPVPSGDVGGAVVTQVM